jgi:hypothetical protein
MMDSYLGDELLVETNHEVCGIWKIVRRAVTNSPRGGGC